MGSCMGSQSSAPKNGKQHASSPKPEEDTQNSPGIALSTLGEDSILDLFPAARRRCAVRGVPSDANQKGFADKLTSRGGEEPPATFKVGFACKKGLKPESPNQDDFCVFRVDDTSILGVFDGHGPYGHDLSNFVQVHLPRHFIQALHVQKDPEKALARAFSETHRLCTESQAEGRFDCSLSGTTGTLAMHRDGVLYLAHVGDCRTVLAKKSSGQLVCEELTTDHKPVCDAERTRIEAAGGQVKRLEGDIPYRVFVPGKMYPGLSMTRTIGDTLGASAGITSMPDVRSLKVQKDWLFLLICSDGIWEFMKPQQAVDIVGRHSGADAQTAAEALAAEAWNKWIEEENNVVDDITVIVSWFNES